MAAFTIDRVHRAKTFEASTAPEPCRCHDRAGTEYGCDVDSLLPFIYVKREYLRFKGRQAISMQSYADDLNLCTHPLIVYQVFVVALDVITVALF